MKINDKIVVSMNKFSVYRVFFFFLFFSSVIISRKPKKSEKNIVNLKNSVKINRKSKQLKENFDDSKNQGITQGKLQALGDINQINAPEILPNDNVALAKPKVKNKKLTGKKYWQQVSLEIVMMVSVYLMVKYLIITIGYRRSYMDSTQYEQASVGLLIPLDNNKERRLTSLNKVFNRGENFELIQSLCKRENNNFSNMSPLIRKKINSYNKLFEQYMEKSLKKYGWDGSDRENLKIQINAQGINYSVNIFTKNDTINVICSSGKIDGDELLLIRAILALKYNHSYTSDIHTIFNSMAKTILQYNGRQYDMPAWDQVEIKSFSSKIRSFFYKQKYMIWNTINPMNLLNIH